MTQHHSILFIVTRAFPSIKVQLLKQTCKFFFSSIVLSYMQKGQAASQRQKRHKSSLSSWNFPIPNPVSMVGPTKGLLVVTLFSLNPFPVSWGLLSKLAFFTNLLNKKCHGVHNFAIPRPKKSVTPPPSSLKDPIGPNLGQNVLGMFKFQNITSKGHQCVDLDQVNRETLELLHFMSLLNSMY